MVGFNDEDLLVDIEMLGDSSSFGIIGPSGGLYELFGDTLSHCIFQLAIPTGRRSVFLPEWHENRTWIFHVEADSSIAVILIDAHEGLNKIPLRRDSLHLIPLSNPQQTRKRRFTRGRGPSDVNKLMLI